MLVLGLSSNAAAASPPSVTITSPTAGATVKGTVRVEATATASPGDYPTNITFYDGVNEIGQASCQGQQSCTGSVEWQATGLSGQHSLTAHVDTNENQSATSQPVVVTVVSPSPTVKITSPTNGATVKGTIQVSVEAATDPSQEDYPTSITVYDGVNEIDHVDCQGQRTCQGQVEWQATGLTGLHTLTAEVSTNRNLSVTSEPVTVTVLSPPPTVRITYPSSGAPLRGTINVAISGATDPSQDDYPTSISVADGTDEIGSVDCQGQKTCAGTVQWNTSGLNGIQVLRATIHTNRGREATSAPVYVGGLPGKPSAHATCHITSLRTRIRRGVRVRCVAYVPAGTKVAIQYLTSSNGWASLYEERVPPGGQFYFTVRGKRRGLIHLSVLVAQTSHFAATRVPLGTLHIV